MGVEVVEGQVSINQGDGSASPGDLVMASPDGSGKIEYADGCVVVVKPGAVAAVEEQSPCKTGRFGFRPGYLIGAVLIGGGVAAAIALIDGGGNNDKTGDKPASP